MAVRTSLEQTEGLYFITFKHSSAKYYTAVMQSEYPIDSE